MKTTVDISDSALVERVQKGNKQAFNLLVSRYQNKIASVVSRYVHHPGDVPDVVQEVFIKAYRSIPNFKGESAFYTWLYRIAVNTAKNYLTALQSRPPSSDIELDDESDETQPTILKDSENPEQIASSDELRTIILNKLDSLPAELKSVLVLREIEGLSYEEIALKLTCPVGTVRSRIFRARELLDEVIQSYFDGN